MPRLLTRMLCITLPAVCCASLGCSGGGDFETATVHGTVYCNGELLTEGQVVFNPQPRPGNQQIVGKGGIGTISPDGTYELRTYRKGDGAVIGPCRVQVFEPLPNLSEEGEDEDLDVEPQKLACGMTKNDEYIVEVKPGDNVIDIKLPLEKGGE